MNNLKHFSLIVPAAADKLEFQDCMPHIFTPDIQGNMLCIKAITGLNLDIFDNIYFTILRKHSELYDIDKLLELNFRRMGFDNAKIVILENPTITQAETIVRTIYKEKIEGPIFIKDADCFFSAEIFPENGIATYPLEQLDIVDPKNKSYIAIDDMQHITNIIEKRVISNMFNAGGYCFENAEDFLYSYKKNAPLGNIYISHLIYSLLLDGHIFRPIKVALYNDWNICNNQNNNCSL